MVATSRGERLEEYEASAGQILLFEERSMARPDALPITFQAQHRRTGVETSGRRQRMKEESTRATTRL